MRILSTTERAMRDRTIRAQRKAFAINNTSVWNTPDPLTGETVHLIRYGGIFGDTNKFGLA